MNTSTLTPRRVAAAALTFATLILGAQVAIAAPRVIVDPDPQFQEELVVRDHRLLDELVRFGRVEVRRGATLEVTRDVVIEAVTELVVAGSITVAPDPDRVDGVSVHLRAGERIVITGEVRPENGPAGRAIREHGGHGGSLTLDAPIILASRDLVAGRGGDGGPSAHGGDGGSVITRGRLRATVASAVARGGDGGHGGDGTPGSPNGGDGGSGGRAAADDGDEGNDGDHSTGPRGSDGLNGSPCDDGGQGYTGFAALGGIGGNGGIGANAVFAGDDGGFGGEGGEGGRARGGWGGDGGRGGDCSAACSVGGNGGMGGAAAPAWGGAGGIGGDGGDGNGAGANGGFGGDGGSGGAAYGGSGGTGGRGGDCCRPDVGIGGDGGNGGDGSGGESYPGIGGPGGRGGRAGTFDDMGGYGGTGGEAGNGSGGNGGDGGTGGDGWVDVGGGGDGSPFFGAAFPAEAGIGGTGGWPDGGDGFDGADHTPSPGSPGADGSDGKPCNEQSEPGEENHIHHDGSFENGFAWELDEVAPPDYGAFASRFEVQGTIHAVHVHLAQLDAATTALADIYIWADDGGRPGEVLAMYPGRDPGTVGVWPSVTSHRFAVEYAIYPGDDPVVWVGIWGDWVGQPADWFVAVDTNGAGGGAPHTNVAPGLKFPEGWQPVADVFSPAAALGIGLEVEPLGVCCSETAEYEEPGCCEVTSPTDCASAGGTYLGDGVDCGTAPCGVDRARFDVTATSCFELTVTDHGTVGFTDESQLQGSGWRFPAGGSNHLKIGGLWVGLDPDSVLHRDHDADPSPTWELAACPSGQIVVETDLPAARTTWSAMDAVPTTGRDAPVFLHTQRTRVADSPDGCGFAIVEFTAQPPTIAGEERVAHYGMYLDLDIEIEGEDDLGFVEPETGLVYMTDASGAHLGLQLLGDDALEFANLTLIDNAVFQPAGFIPEADKWAFLTGADPEHVLLAAPFPADYGVLASREVRVPASGTWPSLPHFAVAFVVGGSVEELRDNAESAKAAYASSTVSIPEIAPIAPRVQVAPNPFRGQTALHVTLDAPASVSATVYDAGGRRVRTLSPAWFGVGSHVVNWDGRTHDGRDAPTGTYFVEVRVGTQSMSEKVIRIR